MNKPKGHPKLVWVGKCPLTTFKAVKVADSSLGENVLAKAV